MSKRDGWWLRRRFSGFLAFVVMFIYVFNHTSISLFFAAPSEKTATLSDAVREGDVMWKNCPGKEVQMMAVSDQNSYGAGDFVRLDLYIKNDSDQTLTDGQLQYRAKGIVEDSGCFEDPEAGRNQGNTDRLTGLMIQPKESRHVEFYFEITEEISKTKNQKIEFTFTWEQEGRTGTAVESYEYVAGGQNLLPPRVEESDEDREEGMKGLAAGEFGRLSLDFGTGTWEMREDAAPQAASDSDARPASLSDARRSREEDSAGEEEQVIEAVAYTVETYGIRLDQFREEDWGTDMGDNDLACYTFRVDPEGKPGTYFGKVTAVYQVEGREYISTQGFAIRVRGEEVTTWEQMAEEIRLGGTKTICLAGDIPKPQSAELPIIIPEGADITLDLNGHTLTCDDSVYPGDGSSYNNRRNLFVVSGGGSFTVESNGAEEPKPVPRKVKTISGLTRFSMRVTGVKGNTKYDPNNKTINFSVIQDISNDVETGGKQTSAVDIYQIKVGSVGAIECSNINNAIDVEAGGTVNIKGGRITAAESNRAVLAAGGTINMSGGYIVGNDSRPNHNTGATQYSNGGGILVISAGQLNMSGGVVANNKVTGITKKRGIKADTGKGGGICLKGGSRAVIGGDAVIAGNIADIGNGGGIYAVQGSSVLVKDNAVIAGNLAQSSASNPKWDGSGGGICLAPSLRGEVQNTLTMDGGTVIGNIAEAQIECTGTEGVGGGGIFAGGDIRIQGGCLIKNNYALEGGGGILIWNKANPTGHEVENYWGVYHCPDFVMSDSTVEGNVCDGSEGGGIRCEGSGMITSGVIRNNVTNTKYDFGGGGIYVEMFSKDVGTGGNMTIQNAEITDNIADGYGGGVAGCGKSTINVLTVKGAAIYGNQAAGVKPTCEQGNAGDHLVEKYYPEFSQKPDGTPQDKAERAKDYFCVGQSEVYDYMLGGGSHDWTGTSNHDYILSRKDQSGEKADPIHVSFVYLPDSNGIPAPEANSGVAGLTANPSPEDIQKVKDNTRVLITGNASTVHGGGIACNGILSMGVVPTGRLRLTKKVVGEAGEDFGKEFTFVVTLSVGEEELKGEYPYSGSKEGFLKSGGTVKLKDGEFIEIKGLPEGTRYRVSEETQEGYEVDIQVKEMGGQPALQENIREITGDLAAGDEVLTEVTFINEKKQPPESSDDSSESSEESSGESSESSGESSDESSESSKDPSESSEDPSESSEDPSESSKDPSESSDDPGESTEDPGGPDETTGRPDESTHPSSESPDDPDEPEQPGGEGDRDPDPERPRTPPETTAPSSETTTVPPETEPSPETPGIPVLPELPDPNDPDSPQRVTIMEEGVPTTYVKVWDPEQEAFLYIPEGEVPLFGLPGMGQSERKFLCWVLWFAMLGGLGEAMMRGSKKRRAKED